MASPHGQGHGLSTAAVAAVGVGIGVAAVAGFAAAGAVAGAGLLVTSAARSGRRGSRPPLRQADIQWDDQGRLRGWPSVVKAVHQGGLEPATRADVWPLLLGVFAPASSAAERERELERLRRLYTKLVLVCEELDRQLEALKSASASGSAVGSSPGSSPRKSPLPLPGNLVAFAESHRIIVMDAVRTDIQRQAAGGPIGGGPPSPTLTILPVSVGDGLPELMMVSSPMPEPAPADAVAAGRVPLWRSALAADALAGAVHLNHHTRRQMLRLINLLSAYAVHDPETGYCQGMSDIAAVFVQLFDDDALAFAAFERLMRSARRNFRHDEAGIKYQLSQIGRIVRDTDPSLWRHLESLDAADCMFAYRMVIVMLRRELPPNECCTLWEIQWALEAAEDLEAAAAAAAGSPAAAALADACAPVPRTNSGGSATAGMAAAAGASSPLRSTVQGMAEAAARAVVEGAAAVSSSSSGGSKPATPLTARRPSSSTAAADKEPPPEFLLQFIAAVVRGLRGRILAECAEHDDVLRLFSCLKIDFWLALAQARKQYRAYRQGSLVMRRLQ